MQGDGVSSSSSISDLRGRDLGGRRCEVGGGYEHVVAAAAAAAAQSALSALGSGWQFNRLFALWAIFVGHF